MKYTPSGGCIDISWQTKQKNAVFKVVDTGIGIEKERMLSAMFIKSANYGTRNTTLIMIQNSGHVNFMEKTYLNDRQNYQTLKFEFRIDG